MGTIGDTIWLDEDGDGTQDPGEDGIPGVTVLLKDENGNVIDTQITDAQGMYLFEGLQGGTYTVCVDTTTLPPDLVQTGDPDGTLDDETTVILQPGEDELDADFGYQSPPGSIGDRIWLDEDGDGEQDPGEPGIPGVTVLLKDENGNVLDTDVTDANGMYLFEDLPTGTYTICVDTDTLPPGLDQTGDPDGTLDDETTTTLEPGESDLDNDFGYQPSGTIGDTIWLDEDGDGSQDPGEPGIPGVTVILKDENGNVLDTQITDADGLYLFEGLAGGTYTVCVDTTTLPPDLVQTGDPDGTLDDETTVILQPGEDELDADFGYQSPPGSIGDRVWEDTNGDGMQDPGEPGIPGVTVILKDENGNVLDTDVTDGRGMYLFEDLPAGTYTICIDTDTLPDGYDQTGDPDGTLDDETTTTLEPGGSDLDNDFGYQPPGGTIGDTIWLDIDGDGTQGPGEPGIPGVTVILKDENGNVVATQVTDADGMYLFEDIPAGTYTICVDETTLPPDLTQTGDPDGTFDGETTVTLEPGDVFLDGDFGYQPLGEICGTIFEDTNGNGVQDPGEPGLPGVTVELLDEDGNVIDTVVTDANGDYCFEDVPGGDYEVCVNETTIPADWNQTADPDPTLDGCTDVMLPPGGSSLDNDFGYQPPNGSIGDRIWLDLDGDGVQDAGEPGIPGVTVLLKDANGNVIATQVTDANGNYLFTDLPAGTYTVCVDVTTLPGDLTQTGDPDGTFDNETTVVLDAGGTDLDNDFGYQPLGEICGTIFEDTNGNGVQDPGEPGLPGVTVELLDANGNVIDTVVTDANGDYCFDGLPGGDYQVCVDEATLPDDYTQTADPDGVLDGCTDVMLPPGGSSLDNDFGYQPPPDLGTIGDTIWFDQNFDGVEDPSEPGIPGVTVILKDENGNVVDTQVTDADGMYLFEDVPAGTYTICVDTDTLPPGWIPTGDPDGTLDNETTILLDEGEIFLDGDFGYYVPHGCIPGFTLDEFNDVSYGNNDGSLTWSGPWIENDSLGGGAEEGYVRVVPEGGLRLGHMPDSGDSPSAMRGVNLEFRTAAGLQFDWLITSGADVDDVAILEISSDGGATWTPLEEFRGIPENEAISGSSTINISAFMAEQTLIRFHLDDGFHELSEFLYIDNVKVIAVCKVSDIGDRIWEDTDGDGVQDPGEPGINGVTVDLTDADGNVVATEVTSADGDYLFTDLGPGNYTVGVDASTLPDDYTPTFDPDGGLDDEANGTLFPGDDFLGVDFGYMPPPLLGSICGTVWEDTNGDGRQNNGEVGIPGVTVTLKDADGTVLDTTTTDGNGDYCFENLPGGDYLVCVDPPDGLDPTFDPDGDLDNETPISLDPGGNEDDVDFGYEPELDPCPPALDFELDANGHPLVSGQIVDDEFAGMTLSTNDPTNHPLMIFDSADPTGGDLDLGTPNQDFGGPGIGAGGGVGEAGENALARGKILIISEDGDSGDPDDNGNGGTITFDFHAPVELSHVGLLDIEEEGGTIVAFDESGAVITTSEIPTIGDNGYQVVLVGASGVAKLDIHLASSGAVTDVVFCAELCVFNWNGVGGRALYMPEISTVLAFEPDPGLWQEHADGTARIVGEVTDQNDFGNQGFEVEFILTGRYTDGTWIYYSDWTGTLTGTGNWAGAELATVGTGDDFQFGYGANQKDDDLGVSGWFDWTVVSQPDSGPHLPEYGKGDINADIADCEAKPHVVCEGVSVRDEFDDVSYDNNDGPDDWAGGWVEDDPESDGAGASKGAVRVSSNALRLDDNEDTGGEPSAARSIDLSSALDATCTLSYGYDTDHGVDEEDAVTVEVSSDGGATYSTLEVITGIDGDVWDSSEFDISDYASADTTIRFRVTSYYGGDDEHIWFDDIDVTCVCP